MKRLTAILLCALMAAGVLSGCGASPPAQPPASPAAPASQDPPATAVPEPVRQKTTVRVGAIRGPSGMGMAGLMERQQQDIAENDYLFALAGAPENMTAMILSGEVDIAAVPTNLAAVLYNRTNGGVSLIAAGTLGVLYILDATGEINAIADLRGKTINATGQGAVPEYVLNYLLEQNGLVPGIDVDVVYRAEHSELAALMLAGRAEIAMLPQPFVTTVTSQDDNVRIAVDLTAEWDRFSPDSPLIMTGIVARNEFLRDNKEAVDIFLREYAQSVDFANNNVEQAAELMEKFDIIPAAVARRAIPYCNLVSISGEGLEPSAARFLDVIFSANPQSVGGQLPDEGFYYTG